MEVCDFDASLMWADLNAVHYELTTREINWSLYTYNNVVFLSTELLSIFASGTALHCGSLVS
jgi:hypothetical protein